MDTPIISIRGLRKNYGANQVLRGIDMDIYPGQVIGYIGPNGAGKSTTVRILIGLDGQFEGEVKLKGYDVKTDALAVKKLIGYVPEQAEMYEVLSPMEFLELVGALHHMDKTVLMERATRMLRFFGLEDHKDQRIDTFSKGMRQKVLLISGLIHNPEIIFLDEPLSGLDANSVILVKEIIARLAAEGKTIFYCSHMMDVVEKVSDRIILINQGQIIADGPFAELKEREGESLEQLFTTLTRGQNYESLAGDFLDAFQDKKSDDE
ncbi:MAG: ABC transporter ATP-binding protein [Saprospiraceae bacterium]